MIKPLIPTILPLPKVKESSNKRQFFDKETSM